MGKGKEQEGRKRMDKETKTTAAPCCKKQPVQAEWSDAAVAGKWTREKVVNIRGYL